jgi:hypothetical protein
MVNIPTLNSPVLRSIREVCSQILTERLWFFGRRGMNSKATIADLLTTKRKGRKTVAASCYDYTMARLAAQADVA